MPDKHLDSQEDDQSLFRDAMRDVNRFPQQTKVISLKPAPKLKKRARTIDEESLSTFSDHEILPSLSSDDLVEYKCSGLQQKSLRKLRSGQYNVETTLDLHGMSVDQAREALHQFLAYCRDNHARSVLIIHGKGHSLKPILKNKLNHWLRQTPQVIAFCSATAREGRSGAMYVLLKDQKRGGSLDE